MIKILEPKLLLFFVFLISSFTVNAGIYRHDVSKEEYLKLAKQKQFDCVGRAYCEDKGIGSCVLISNSFIISAAHCFNDSESIDDSIISPDGKKSYIRKETNPKTKDLSKLKFVFNDIELKAKRIIIHPNYYEIKTFHSCDIALIELETPITSISPAIINTDFDELNSHIVGVGFGASGPANAPNSVNFYNKKIAGENVVDSISGSIFTDFKINGQGTLLHYDFDTADSIPECNIMGSPIPLPLEYLGSGGDSGGGIFRFKDNQWKLLGIHSGSINDMEQFIKYKYYGSHGYWTRLSLFVDWIKQIIEK